MDESDIIRGVKVVICSDLVSAEIDQNGKRLSYQLGSLNSIFMYEATETFYPYKSLYVLEHCVSGHKYKSYYNNKEDRNYDHGLLQAEMRTFNNLKNQ